MEHSTAQRRLVKSAPELWAEISSESSLARHLAEFGEIRITRVEPETTVAWEGDRASGTVELAPTGWGTKVTLTASTVAESGSGGEPQAVAVPDAVALPGAVAVPEPVALPGTVAPPEPVALPEPVAVPQGAAVPQPVAAPQHESITGEPSHKTAPPRRGFFARLFRRLTKPRRSAPPPDAHGPKLGIPTPPAPTPDPSPPTPGPDPTPPDVTPPIPPPPGPVPVPDPTPPVPDPPPPPPPAIRTPPDRPPAAASAAPPLDPGRTAAILSEILDDLGSAHRRPVHLD